MQIHFYNQWDKHWDKGATKRSLWKEGPIIQLVMISIGILTALVFSYLIFAGHNGQALEPQQVQEFKPQDILYTVQKGDTLWSIAVQYYPEIAREEAVQRIQQKNGFQGTTIHAGQAIWLP